jgi:hypothetical protein
MYFERWEGGIFAKAGQMTKHGPAERPITHGIRQGQNRTSQLLFFSRFHKAKAVPILQVRENGTMGIIPHAEQMMKG